VYTIKTVDIETIQAIADIIEIVTTEKVKLIEKFANIGNTEHTNNEPVIKIKSIGTIEVCNRFESRRRKECKTPQQAATITRKIITKRQIA
jgi:hypothetical protein